MPKQLFPLLDHGLGAAIEQMNPWWEGTPIPDLLPRRRWLFDYVLRNLKGGLAPGTVLRGPRQVGKTTLLNQVIDALLEEGIAAKRIFRLQFDELPELRSLEMPLIELANWYSKWKLGKSFARAVADGERPFFILDEVQNLADWAPQLKHLIDICRVRALVTGSSALRIEAGRDSLAGRIQTVDLGPLLLREVAAFRGLGELPAFLPQNGLGPLKQRATWSALRDHGVRHAALRHSAFTAFSKFGSYPAAHASARDPEDLFSFLRETVIRRAIQHDLRTGPRGQRRDEHLLEEVFRLACRYAGQAPKQAFYLDEIRRAMGANIGWQRVLAYLRFLDGTLLIRLVEPLELRLKRRKGAAKICLADHALRAAWLQENIPIDPAGLEAAPQQSALAGHIAESVAGHFLGSIPGIELAHFPERSAEPEVDFVLTLGDQRIPIEVKYRRRLRHDDSHGLRAFIEKAAYRAPFGILVTLDEAAGTDDPRIVSMPLSSLLLLR